MKQILAVIVLLTLMWISNKAFSKEIGFMPNRAGGRIVITDDKCFVDGKAYDYFFKAFYYTKDNDTNYGCWRWDNGTVYVIWHELPEYGMGATEKRYDPKQFYKPDGKF